MTETGYDVGDNPRLTFSFRDLAGDLVDATTVTVTVRAPDGTSTSYTGGSIVHDTTGLYHVDIDPVTQAGSWTYVGVGTGTAADTVTGAFYVKAPQYATVGLTTLERLRLHVLRDATDDSADAKLTLYGETISDRVTDFCGRQFQPDPVSDDDDPVPHVFAYDGEGNLDLYPFELRPSDDLAITLYTDRDVSLQQTIDVTRYRLNPRGGNQQGTFLSVDLPLPTLAPLYYGLGWQVTITGRWGMAAVPRPVELAVWISVDDVMKNPGGFQTQDLGGYVIGSGDVQGFDMDPRGGLPKHAIWALSKYRRVQRESTIQIQGPRTSPRRSVRAFDLPRP